MKAEIPVLIGIDIMDRERIYAINVENHVIHADQQWKIPIPRKFGHVYLVWDKKMLGWKGLRQ